MIPLRILPSGIRRRGLLPARALLFGRRLPVAFLQATHYHVGDELFFAMVVEFDDDPLVAAGYHAAQPELQMFDLSALGEIVGSHKLVVHSVKVAGLGGNSSRWDARC